MGTGRRGDLPLSTEGKEGNFTCYGDSNRVPSSSQKVIQSKMGVQSHHCIPSVSTPAQNHTSAKLLRWIYSIKHRSKFCCLGFTANLKVLAHWDPLCYSSVIITTLTKLNPSFPVVQTQSSCIFSLHCD